MLRINAGPETAKVLEQTRRSMADLKTSIKRVASGLKIEGAGDDPGAIGSVTLSESAIIGVQRTLKNLNEGITVTQALSSDLLLVEELLLTLREVAEQAASDQYTDIQRAELQTQAQSILKKIDEAVRIAGDQEGLDLTQRDTLTISGSSELNLNTQLVITDLLVDELGKRAIYTSQRNGVFTSGLDAGDLIINGVEIRPTTSDDDINSTTASDGSAIAKANAINAATYLTGVTAEAGPTEITGNRPVSAIELTGLNYFSVNGAVITGVSVGDNDSTLGDQTGTLREAINAETRYTGVTASLDSSGQLTLSAEDGRNIYINYSNQDVLDAIGVTDKEGDAPNLLGDVALGTPDRDLNGELQLPITTDFQTYNGTNVGVSGRFDASEDYIDFVAQVVKAGSFGVAEFRLDRDAASEAVSGEAFEFIEGIVSSTLNTTGVAGDFFSTGGTATGGGSYNEALDREYILTVTQEGTTDGANRAEFEVSTTQDGVVGSFTASALSPINIAGARTGEDVTITFSDSTRNSDLTSALAAGHEYDSSVTIGGTYNGDVDSTTTVEVITSGRTQGSPQAVVQVYHDGVLYGGPVTVSADTPIDIGNGQTLSFAADFPIFSAVTATTTGTYTQAVTVASDPVDFTGIGAATYEVEVTQAGSVDEARYVVNKDGVEVVGEALLTQGVINVADGITFNIPDAPPTINDTTVTPIDPDLIDHYQDYASAQFTGTYDGTLNDTTLEVRVKTEGIVLDAATDETGRSDYATLEYRFGGAGAFAGDLVARTGGVLVDRGVELDLASISADPTIFETSSGTDLGVTGALDPLSIGGYNGTIEFSVDKSLFPYGEDVRVLFSSASSMTIPDAGAQTETLTVKLISQTTGAQLSSVDINPVSGVSETLAPGLTVTFTNAEGASATLDAAVGNDDVGVITLEAGATYNGDNGADEVLFRFVNQTSVTVERENVNNPDDGVVASVGSDVYNGIYGDKTITLQLGTAPATQVSLLDTGANGVDDGASVSLTGTYSGANAGDDLRVEFLNRLSVNVTPDAGNDDGTFSMGSDLVGSQDINRAYADLTLDISVAKSVETVVASIPAGAAAGEVFVVGEANGNYFGNVTFNRTNASKFKLATDIDTNTNLRYSTYVVDGVLDLGQADLLYLFGGVDPGFDLNVGGATQSPGDYSFVAQEAFDYTFTDPNSGANATTRASGGVIDLNAEPLASTFFAQGDPGFDLTVSNEADAVDDSFELTWSIDPTAGIYRQSGGAQQNYTIVDLNLNGDQTQATFDLNDASLAGVFNEGPPDVTLVVDDPLNAVDDTWSLLGVDPSVAFSDGVNTVEGVELLTSYTLSDAQFASLFPDGSPGDVVINLSNIAGATDDRFLINLESDTDVYVSEVDLTNSQLVTVDPVTNKIDLGQAAVTSLLNGGFDPGFDLDVTDRDFGIDDQYTLRLSSLPSLAAQADNEVVFVNQHSLQIGDVFSVDLSAERFAVGDTFSVDVDSEHLQDGSVYTIENTLGKFLVGDQIKLNTTHDFQAPTYVLDSSVSILNGLSLDFAQDGSFEIGDEVRFQVRGYTGDPVASGTYTNAISPTTFTVEVTSTGDVDGGVATFQYTRADTGETVGGFSVTSGATELADGVEIAFTAGRVYQGDRFIINAFESLNQTFGGQLTLSSANSIALELADTETDNLLGRLAYTGSDPSAPGELGNPTSALLGLNQETAVGNVDVSTQSRAQRSLTYTDNARESLSQYQRRVALTQAELEDISTRLEDDLVLKLDDLERRIKADPREEGERIVKSTQRNESSSLIASLTQRMSQSSMSLMQQSFIAPSVPEPREIKPPEPPEPPAQVERAKRGEKSPRASAEERTAAQRKARKESSDRLEEMVSKVEAAQQRTAATAVSLDALRQLSQASLEVNAAESERARAAVRGGESALSASLSSPLSSSLASISDSTPISSFTSSGRSVSADSDAEERAAVRQAEEALSEVQSYLQDMKSLALEVQAETSGFSLESQQAELEELIADLRSLETPVIGEDELSGDRRPKRGLGADLSRVEFSSAVTRQLGRFASSESAGGVDPSLALRDGALLVITPRGERIPVRGTRSSDDPDSTRDALGSAKAKASAINEGSAQHGITALAGPTLTMSAGEVGAASLTRESLLRINNVQISGFSVQAGDADGALRGAINAVSDQTGVRAFKSRGGALRLSASDGRNITIDAYGEATKLGFTPRGAGVAESSIIGGALTLSSREVFRLDLDDARGGLDRPLGRLDALPITRSIERLDLTTREGRADALSVIELALGDLNAIRRAFGLTSS